MIRDILTLDHFYVGFNKREFAEAKHLQKILSSCVYQEVKSGKDSWRGIYIRSNIGTYFEIVESDLNYSLGIACSPWRSTTFDVRKIKNELKKLPWKSIRRLWGKTNKTWFDAIMLKQPKDFANEPLNSWIMHYHQVHADSSSRKPRLASFERYKHAIVKMGDKHLPNLKYKSQWLPGTASFSKKSVDWNIPNRDGGRFNLLVELESGDSMARFVELSGMPCADVKTKNYRGRALNLKVSNKQIVLSARS